MASDDRDVSDEHYAAVGKVASAWALFEGLVDVSIWQVAGLNPQNGACITAQITGSARKLDALISLVRHHHGDAAVAKLNKIAQTSQGLAEQRNRIVHDPWIQEGGSPARLETTARKRVVVATIAVSTTEVNRAVDDISTHIDAFEAIINPLAWPKS